MLEDDLKISSDEEDNEQAAEKPKPRSAPLNSALGSILQQTACMTACLSHGRETGSPPSWEGLEARANLEAGTLWF
ncbi:hypothetical protein DPX16_19003 [Anabarilius grahami]|uniref:Uncharacterized protein n=1 Tax=Anabarilius grahami TaxID=495550 RepID=A0A3N0YLW8_ANAGA|nr:hypothetical protein DPX16_19003 [Anabarilius grahami]